MKLRELLHGLISRLRDERGGITLEASIVLPAFLFVVLFLIFMIRMAAVQMALQDVAGQTVRLAAAHIRPAALAAEAAEGVIPALPSLPQLPMAEIGPLAAELAGSLPEPAGSLLEAIVKGDWQPVVDMTATSVGQQTITPLLRSMASDSVLVKERLRLERLALPNLQGGEDSYLSMEVAYDFPLGLPFTARSITLSATAAERVWISDAEPAAMDDTGQDETAQVDITILAIEPTPLRPGMRARVVASSEPNMSLTLEVRYKSGTSKAKHLGEAVTDENGVVEWEWHVSGNTTPGLWEFVVTGPDGSTVTHAFEVRKKRT